MVKRLIDYLSPLFSFSLHQSRTASMQGAAHTTCNFVTSDPDVVPDMEPILTSTRITVNGRPWCGSPVTFALLPQNLYINAAFVIPRISSARKKLDHRSFFLVCSINEEATVNL
jgi:hypothetical protein